MKSNKVYAYVLVLCKTEMGFYTCGDTLVIAFPCMHYDRIVRVKQI